MRDPTANDVLDYTLEHSTAGQDTIRLHGWNQLLVFTISSHLPLCQRSSRRHSSMCSLRWRQPCCLGFCRAMMDRTTWRPWWLGTLTGDRRTGQLASTLFQSLEPRAFHSKIYLTAFLFSPKPWDRIQSRSLGFELQIPRPSRPPVIAICRNSLESNM